MSKLPRSPTRVAILTLLVVLGVGLIGSITFLSVTGRLSDHPHERGEAAGRGLFTIAAISAGVAYAIQSARNKRR